MQYRLTPYEHKLILDKQHLEKINTDLIKALQDIINYRDNDVYNLHGDHEMWDYARAAIAKASGK